MRKHKKITYDDDLQEIETRYKTVNQNNDGKIIHKTETYFKGLQEREIEPEKVIEKINFLIDRLIEEPSDQVIDETNYELDRMFIITMGDVNVWLTGNIAIRKILRKRSIFKRISKLIATGGVWYGGVSAEGGIETDMCVKVPIHLNLTAKINQEIDDKIKTKPNEKTKDLIVRLIQFNMLLKNIKKQNGTPSIYTNADATATINNINHWIASDNDIQTNPAVNKLSVRDVVLSIKTSQDSH